MKREIEYSDDFEMRLSPPEVENVKVQIHRGGEWLDAVVKEVCTARYYITASTCSIGSKYRFLMVTGLLGTGHTNTGDFERFAVTGMRFHGNKQWTGDDGLIFDESLN